MMDLGTPCLASAPSDAKCSPAPESRAHSSSNFSAEGDTAVEAATPKTAAPTNATAALGGDFAAGAAFALGAGPSCL